MFKEKFFELLSDYNEKSIESLKNLQEKIKNEADKIMSAEIILSSYADDIRECKCLCMFAMMSLNKANAKSHYDQFVIPLADKIGNFIKRYDAIQEKLPAKASENQKIKLTDLPLEMLSAISYFVNDKRLRLINKRMKDAFDRSMRDWDFS